MNGMEERMKVRIMKWLRRAVLALRLVRVRPRVRVELIDVEVETRANTGGFGNDEHRSHDAAGLEFRLTAFNAAGQQVCTGKFNLIPHLQVHVRQIDTPREHRRRGYARAVVHWLIVRFDGLPVVPVNETAQGFLFWQALRASRLTGLFVQDQIDVNDASVMLERAGRDRVS